LQEGAPELLKALESDKGRGTSLVTLIAHEKVDRKEPPQGKEPYTDGEQGKIGTFGDFSIAQDSDAQHSEP
jgi:hypothetical protein